MDVEQTLKVLEKEAAWYEEEAQLGGREEALQECRDNAVSIRNAIAIIKAAKEYVEAKAAFAEADKTRFSQTDAFCEAGRVLDQKEARFLSLLSPEQKKEV